jgi:hypothetical protein
MSATDELVTIFTSMDQTEALLYRAMLEEAGIAVLGSGGLEAWVAGLPANLRRRPVRLQVRRGDAARALELVEAYRQSVQAGRLELPEEQVAPETERMVASSRAFRRRSQLIMQCVILLMILVVLVIACWPQR